MACPSFTCNCLAGGQPTHTLLFARSAGTGFFASFGPCKPSGKHGGAAACLLVASQVIPRRSGFMRHRPKHCVKANDAGADGPKQSRGKAIMQLVSTARNLDLKLNTDYAVFDVTSGMGLSEPAPGAKIRCHIHGAERTRRNLTKDSRGRWCCLPDQPCKLRRLADDRPRSRRTARRRSRSRSRSRRRRSRRRRSRRSERRPKRRRTSEGHGRFRHRSKEDLAARNSSQHKEVEKKDQLPAKLSEAEPDLEEPVWSPTSSNDHVTQAPVKHADNTEELPAVQQFQGDAAVHPAEEHTLKLREGPGSSSLSKEERFLCFWHNRYRTRRNVRRLSNEPDRWVCKDEDPCLLEGQRKPRQRPGSALHMLKQKLAKTGTRTRPSKGSGSRRGVKRTIAPKLGRFAKGQMSAPARRSEALKSSTSEEWVQCVQHGKWRCRDLMARNVKGEWVCTGDDRCKGVDKGLSSGAKRHATCLKDPPRSPSRGIHLQPRKSQAKSTQPIRTGGNLVPLGPQRIKEERSPSRRDQRGSDTESMELLEEESTAQLMKNAKPTSAPTLSMRMCAVHKKLRHPERLERCGRGWICKSSDSCRTSGPKKPERNDESYVCEIHNRVRTVQNMEKRRDGKWICKPECRCLSSRKSER
eukprot:s4963_g2.t1